MSKTEKLKKIKNYGHSMVKLFLYKLISFLSVANNCFNLVFKTHVCFWDKTVQIWEINNFFIEGTKFNRGKKQFQSLCSSTVLNNLLLNIFVPGQLNNK